MSREVSGVESKLLDFLDSMAESGYSASLERYEAKEKSGYIVRIGITRSEPILSICRLLDGETFLELESKLSEEVSQDKVQNAVDRSRKLVESLKEIK